MGTYLAGCTRCGTVNVVTVEKNSEPTAVPIQHEWASVARFVAQRCTLHPSLRTDTTSIVTAYRTWCDDRGFPALPNQVIGRAFEGLFEITRTRSNGVRYYTGIALAE